MKLRRLDYKWHARDVVVMSSCCNIQIRGQAGELALRERGLLVADATPAVKECACVCVCAIVHMQIGAAFVFLNLVWHLEIVM